MLGRFQSGEAASSDEDRRFGQIHLDKIQHQRLVERVIETSRDDLRFGHRSAFEPCKMITPSEWEAGGAGVASSFPARSK
jgi:hypothetical protein